MEAILSRADKLTRNRRTSRQLAQAIQSVGGERYIDLFETIVEAMLNSPHFPAPCQDHYDAWLSWSAELALSMTAASAFAVIHAKES